MRFFQGQDPGKSGSSEGFQQIFKEDQGKELCEKKSEDGHSDESLLDHELLFSLVFHTVSGKTI